eukprot:TRINITY_DN1481_c0_g1_i1.p1 TRINITY_DN1481_c0_g1~~TRINITY_DN1481_c0_g1_i1.p1  ORF type:complete len:213 (-),score=58.79 TRINITY_DN1481_c0_g1_i1:24-662(-)
MDWSFQVLLFFQNGYEFLRRVVNADAKAEFLDMVSNLPELVILATDALSTSIKDSTFNAVNQGMDALSQLDNELSAAIGRWSRMERSQTGYGNEVDQVPVTLEAFEQAINSCRNPIVKYINARTEEEKGKEEERQRQEEEAERIKAEQEKMREEQEEALRLQKEQEEAEAAALAAQFEGRELDKQIYELTEQYEDLDLNDPNASILNALMDF